jgi:hypothetical protein
LNNNRNTPEDPIVKTETKATQQQTINTKDENTNAALEKEQTEIQVAATTAKPEQKNKLNYTEEILPVVSKQQSENMITANVKQETKEKTNPQLPQPQQKLSMPLPLKISLLTIFHRLKIIPISSHHSKNRMQMHH